MRRAATLGDGIMPYFVTPEKYAELRGQVQTLLVAGGRAEVPFQFAVSLFVSVAKTVEEGRKAAVDYIRWQYGMDGEPLVDRYAIYGPPDRCAERYAQYADAGVTHFVNIPVGRGPFAEQLARIREVTHALA
jgi:alkanesulfonate monooxygenase SsuD/methylene tetrahydromethanopterin reductase-like flavin-dependent oxidoreductase (luciferase family)